MTLGCCTGYRLLLWAVSVLKHLVRALPTKWRFSSDGASVCWNGENLNLWIDRLKMRHNRFVSSEKQRTLSAKIYVRQVSFIVKAFLLTISWCIWLGKIASHNFWDARIGSAYMNKSKNGKNHSGRGTIYKHKNRRLRGSSAGHRSRSEIRVLHLLWNGVAYRSVVSFSLHGERAVGVGVNLSRFLSPRLHVSTVALRLLKFQPFEKLCCQRSRVWRCQAVFTLPSCASWACVKDFHRIWIPSGRIERSQLWARGGGGSVLKQKPGWLFSSFRPGVICLYSLRMITRPCKRTVSTLAYVSQTLIKYRCACHPKRS